MTKGKIEKEESKVACAGMTIASKHKIVKAKSTDVSLPFKVTDYHKKALSKLLFCHHTGQTLTYLELSDEIGAGPKTKAWQCGAWKDLKTQGLILPSHDSTKGKMQLMLSEKGVTVASTFASDEELADYKMPETNEEHHEKIKSKMMRQDKARKYGPKIFDLMVKEDYTPMNKHDLAAKFNTLADSHGFFYGLQTLKKMGLIDEVKEEASSITKAKPTRMDKAVKKEEGDDAVGAENKGDPKKTKKRSGGKLLQLSERAFLTSIQN